MNTMIQDQNIPVRTKTPRMTESEEKRIVRLRTENKLPVTEIAELVGRATSTVYEYLKKVDPNNQQLQEFKGKEADTLAFKKFKTTGLQLLALKAIEEKGEMVFSDMTPDKIARFYKDIEIANSCSTEKERLIRGLATNIHGYADLESAERQANDQLRALGIDPDKVLDEPQDVVSSPESTESVTSDTQ